MKKRAEWPAYRSISLAAKAIRGLAKAVLQGLVLELVLVLVVLYCVRQLVLVHLVLETTCDAVGWLCSVSAQILVMTWLVSTIVGSVERIGVVEGLVLVKLTLAADAVVEATASHVRWLSSISSQVLVMTWLVSTVVGRMERTRVSELLLIVELASVLTISALAELVGAVLTIKRLHHTCRLEAALCSAVLGDTLVRAKRSRLSGVSTQVLIMALLVPTVACRVKLLLLVHGCVFLLQDSQGSSFAAFVRYSNNEAYTIFP